MKKLTLRTKGGRKVVLDIDATQVEITEPLDSFTNLGEDLTALSRIKRLALKSPFGSLDNVDFLSSVPELRALDIRARPLDRIRDWSGLSALKKLDELSANDYARCDLSKLATRKLRKLSIYVPSCKGVELIFLQKELRSLCMQMFYTADMKVFASLSKLKELRIRGGRIGSLEGLSALADLRKLELVLVGLRSGDQLAQLTRLEHSDLSSNKRLQDLAFVARLHKLRSFSLLDVPRVLTFKPLAGLALESLEISAQPADKDLSPLKSLKRLKTSYFHPKVSAHL